MADQPDIRLQLAHTQHGRHWRNNAYCYPVISRRSGGLSIGINLNPDQACNFDCIYCQVDRSSPPAIRKVDLGQLQAELEQLLDLAIQGILFAEPPFDCLPPAQRAIRDIAFSGDGEPTTSPCFADAVQIATEARRSRRLIDTKLIVITDSCYLMRPPVRSALEVLDANNGEIWAKLDAGTEAYFQMVNRPNYSLAHVLENILDAARVRPLVIQSLWMHIHDQPPPEAEIKAFALRLQEILAAGGQLKLIQIYTTARQTAEPYVTALTHAELDHMVTLLHKMLSIPIEVYYGVNA